MTDTTTRVGDLAHAPPATTTATTRLRAAAADLAGEYRGVLLVTGSKGGVVGVVSERDIVRAVGEGEDPDELRVEDVMTEDVVTIGVDGSIRDALALMDAHEIRHLVVVHGAAPVGVLSMRDLVHALVVAAQPAVVAAQPA